MVDRPQPGIFGLPECTPNSGQPVWWYPFSVIESVREISDVKPRTLHDFLGSIGLASDLLSKAEETLRSEGVTVELLETVIDDDDLQEIGIEKAVMEAISVHRQRLRLETAAEVERHTRHP